MNDLHAEAERIAAVALAEDGPCDITTDVAVASLLHGEGVLEFRSGGVFAGLVFAHAVARQCDCSVEWQAASGAVVPAGAVVGTVRGRLAAVLRAERPILNLLQRACGIAQATRAFVDALADTRCRVLHTRKTAPGLRALDIDAVLAGGGERHRTDLAHQVMIKDNHWQALRRDGRRLADVLDRARERGVTALYVEVETVAQVEEACAAGATRLLIDNQRPETVHAWGELARRRSAGIEIEATGGITLDNVRAYAEAADFVSVGMLTHGVRAADVALEVRF